MTRWDAHGRRCGNCGSWSESRESGLMLGTGYCGQWERLRDRTDTCDSFLTKQAYQREQARLAAENEDWLDG